MARNPEIRIGNYEIKFFGFDPADLSKNGLARAIETAAAPVTEIPSSEELPVSELPAAA